MILLRFFVVIIFVNIVSAKFDAQLPTKENVGEYLTEQYAKNGGVIPEKYDGPVYDDMNVVIDNNVNEPFVSKSDSNDTSSEDEPRLFTFDPSEAPIFRGKRQSGFQPSAPVRSASTGAAIVAHVDSTSDIVPYDAHVDPDFPAEAPVARGLKNVPEGWNLDKEIDYEFQRGYRKGSSGINPSYSGGQGRQYQGFAQQGGNGMDSAGGAGGIEGPYMDSGSYAPLSMGGSSYGGGEGYGGGMSNGYGGMGSSGYGSMNSGYGSMGSSGYGGMSSGYGSMGSGYGNSYGGMSSGYGGLGNSYGGQGGYGYGNLGGYNGYSGYGNSGGYGSHVGLGQGFGSNGLGYTMG